MINAAAEGARGSSNMEPVLMRLQNASSCSPDLQRKVRGLGSRVEALPAKTLLQSDQAPASKPRYLIAGWACRFRHLSDGRRQIFDLILPGEGVGVWLRSTPLHNTSIVALTPLQLVDAQDLLADEELEGDLREALWAQADAEQTRALNQIVRLGRLTALERLAHLLLEVHERLVVIGHAHAGRFSLPLTQEALADWTGLSVVHVNRTLQELRRQDLVSIDRGWVRLSDQPRLARLAEEMQPHLN